MLSKAYQFLIRLAVAAALTTSMTSCSMFVMSQGLKFDRVFTTNATQESLQHKLGAPMNVVSYRPSCTLGSIKEVVSAPARERPRNLFPAIAACADYRFTGLVYDLGAAQAAGMLTGCTFLIGEPFAMAMALDHTSRERKITHRFSCWFGNDGKLVACRWRKPGEPDRWWPDGSMRFF